MSLGHTALGQVAIGQGAGGVIDVSVSEALNAAETALARLAAVGAIAETLNAVDLVDEDTNLNVSASDIEHVADSASSIADFVASTLETSAGTDAQTATGVFGVAVDETGSATDYPAIPIFVSIGETLTASDACSAAVTHNVSVNDYTDFAYYIGSMPGEGAIAEYPVAGGVEWVIVPRTITDSCSLHVYLAAAAMETLNVSDQQSCVRLREPWIVVPDSAADWGACIPGDATAWTCVDENEVA